jgi:predicted HTH transcriptional regulator
LTSKQIAEVFYLTSDIEKYGSGFRVVLFNEKLKANENVTENRLLQIINLITEKPQTTTAEIALSLGVTKRTILRDIEKLKHHSGNKKSQMRNLWKSL